jgi:hypothetical protein
LPGHVLEIIHLADIKGFLSDVKPALLSALDTEYEKNPFEVCCVTVTVWKMLTYCDFVFHQHLFGSIIRVLLLLQREQFEFWILHLLYLPACLMGCHGKTLVLR